MKSYRKQKIKLVKGACEGEKSLCHSLLDISQFENLDEAYAKRKIAFNIAKRNVSFTPYVPISQEQAQYDMTPKEKIEIYKKLNIKDRYHQESIDRFKKMFKIRRSKIPNMLNNLNESMKKQTEEVFEKEIRRSEEKLKFYRSQGKLNEDANQAPNNFNKETERRCKFYSLKTGKPQMNEQLFPTYEEYVEGRKRAKLQKKFEFDISKIEKNLSTFYTDTDLNPEDQSEQMKSSHPLSMLAARIARVSSTTSNRNSSQVQFSQRILNSKTQNINNRKSKIQENLQRFSEDHIQKSQRSSQKIVKTMTNFYKSKNTKKQEYNNMVEYYEHDRPLTNSIRRREYEFMKSNEKIKDIAFYRKESENKRQQLLEFNSRTYKEILNSLSRYHEDDIPISLEILRSIKQLMRREYVFDEDDVTKMLTEIKKKSDKLLKDKEVTDQEEKEDFMIQPVINILNQAYGYNLLWIDL